ncbi:MAG: co-chaperone GroES [Alphaproteobacteria bacterium]
MTFKPLHNNVLVKRLEEETKTAGGIYIPDSAKEKPSRGEVIAVGNGEYQDGDKIPMTVKTGDTILFGKWSGNEVKLDGNDFIIMKESDILGVL